MLLSWISVLLDLFFDWLFEGLALEVALLGVFHEAPEESEETVEQQDNDKDANCVADAHVHAWWWAISLSVEHQEEYLKDDEEYLLDDHSVVVHSWIQRVKDWSFDQLRLDHA